MKHKTPARNQWRTQRKQGVVVFCNETACSNALFKQHDIPDNTGPVSKQRSFCDRQLSARCCQFCSVQFLCFWCEELTCGKASLAALHWIFSWFPFRTRILHEGLCEFVFLFWVFSELCAVIFVCWLTLSPSFNLDFTSLSHKPRWSSASFVAWVLAARASWRRTNMTVETARKRHASQFANHFPFRTLSLV